MTAKTQEAHTAAANPALADAARRLLSASAVRNSAHRMLALGMDGALTDWTVDLERLEPAADFVAQVVREQYPALDPSLHARWRHFVFDVPANAARSASPRRDLWNEMASSHRWADAASKARAAFDLAITSVLLDAGAGPQWSYRDALTGLTAKRSEGLALASLRWFASGGMSANSGDPLRADAAVLERVDAAALRTAFQASTANPLLGAEGRAALLNRLGAAVNVRPDLFALADSPRPGGLFDALAQRAAGAPLRAALVLEALLEAFGPIWENRPSLGGVPLGDCWPHPAFRGDDPAEGYVPLHKLSQWLAYSLIEPLQAAGIAVCNIEELTGLAEYRNGGLFVDMGVLVPRDRAAWTTLHAVSDPFVVAWRAMTVALLDRIAPLVAAKLRLNPEEFNLPRVLEGGTWAAGRRLAREKRADGGPPFQISSDGTVF